MGWLTGSLNLSDTDRSFVNTIGADVVFDAVAQYTERLNTEVMASMGLFVSEQTENYKERYYLPGGGRLDERSSNAPSLAVKASGSWDVAYPLKEYGNQIAGTRVSYAYMTVQKLEQEVNTVTNRYLNTVRYLIFEGLLNSAPPVFLDPDWGNLTIQPLANNDAVLYPPLLGQDVEATSQHYLVSGFASASISDANNPITPIVQLLEGHFGTPTGGSPIVVFCNSAESAKIQALADFDPVTNRYAIPGISHDTVDLAGIPSILHGGTWRVLGVMKQSGAIICQWQFVPAGYLVGLHLGTTPPLKMRVDPAATGLGSGLQLVNQDDDHPFRQSHWEARMGFGVSNRISAAVMQLTTNPSYATPTGY